MLGKILIWSEEKKRVMAEFLSEFYHVIVRFSCGYLTFPKLEHILKEFHICYQAWQTIPHGLYHSTCTQNYNFMKNAMCRVPNLGAGISLHDLRAELNLEVGVFLQGWHKAA